MQFPKKRCFAGSTDTASERPPTPLLLGHCCNYVTFINCTLTALWIVEYTHVAKMNADSGTDNYA